VTEEPRVRFWHRNIPVKTIYHTSAYVLVCRLQVIDFARNVLGLEKANSEEFDPQTPDPVIHIMDDQKSSRR
jgi:CTP synthase